MLIDVLIVVDIVVVVVVIWCMLLGILVVGIDDYVVVYIMMCYLIGLGYCCIGFIKGSFNLNVSGWCFEGYFVVFEEVGIVLDVMLIV